MWPVPIPVNIDKGGGYIDIPIIDDARQDLMSDVSFHFFFTSS